jgi:ferredoxin-NADP reductase
VSRLEWRVATVVRVRDETPRTRSLVLNVPGWTGHRAGQHVDVRLVAEDGYQAQRSYSIASAPEEDAVELTVERLDDGEVSSYLCDVLHPGDGLEVRGPVGGYFVWDISSTGPLLLIGGGSGIVPLMSMLRHRRRADAAARARVPAVLLYSARTSEDLIYKEELETLANGAGDDSLMVCITLTRDAPAGWRGLRGRVDRAMLEKVSATVSDRPNIFVCGPTPFTEAVATLLVELGHEPSRIRTERFGPTG